MLFQGKTIKLTVDQNQIAHMLFDADGESVNKFDLETIDELQRAVAIVRSHQNILGLIVKSAKDTFLVGADIKQFHELFNNSEEDIKQAVVEYNSIFTSLEDLKIPTVCVIDGACLGGGFELALACDYRLASNKASIGLPEVKLGINPGFGGTIRLPRLIGLDNAIEWIATGKDHRSSQALEVGAVDGIVESDLLENSADKIIQQALVGELDHMARKEEKKSPVKVGDMERLMVFTTAKGLVSAQAGPNMPAPVTAVKSMEQSSPLPRDEAVHIEAKYFSRLAKTDVAGNLVFLFLGEQDLSKRMGVLTKDSPASKKVGVLGAGIMGGGIAYQAALKGKRVGMKDVAQPGLDAGMSEASKLLSKRVERGRMSAFEMADTLSRIAPTLHYNELDDAEIIVEAVIENEKIKAHVHSEVEARVSDKTIIASNTSTILISSMADKLARPENFCGMHFFNPVHRMPLVEVIRGKKTNPAAIAKVVKLAKDMGKTPIVVNDCAGFYVNRVLFPYLAGFNLLVRDGIDFERVDKVMEKFGWPMGPAYLIDVVGLDTACHAASVMAHAYPDRMASDEGAAVNVLHNFGRNGQKNGKGFYRYEIDKKGKPKKSPDPEVKDLIRPVIKRRVEVTDEEIIERMMIPMCIEVSRCLDEGIVENAIDAELGLLMGIGFPIFRGGAVRYMESIGLKEFVESTEKYHDLGELYRAPISLVKHANENKSYFSQE